MNESEKRIVETMSNHDVLYSRIFKELKDKIEAGNFSYDAPLCTEKSIVEEYGVSRITAKRAIDELAAAGLVYRKRGVGSFVCQEHRKETGRLGTSSGICARKRLFIALVGPIGVHHPGLNTAYETLSWSLSDSSVYLSFHFCQPGYEQEARLLSRLYREGIDGVVYHPSLNTEMLPDEVLDLFRRDRKPVIILDGPHDNLNYSSVRCDNFHGGYMIAEHLISYGHKKICYLSRHPYERVSSIRDRFDGYVKCMKDHVENAEPRFVKIDAPDGTPFDYPACKHIVNGLFNEGYTAILCENDEVAFYIHMCCTSLRLRLYEDISLAGFDNTPFSITGSANITTIEQDFVQQGKEIASILLEPGYRPQQRVVPVKMIPRMSTGPVPSRKSIHTSMIGYYMG